MNIIIFQFSDGSEVSSVSRLSWPYKLYSRRGQQTLCEIDPEDEAFFHALSVLQFIKFPTAWVNIIFIDTQKLDGQDTVHALLFIVVNVDFLILVLTHSSKLLCSWLTSRYVIFNFSLKYNSIMNELIEKKRVPRQI